VSVAVNLYYTNMLLNWLLPCKIMVNGKPIGNKQSAIDNT